jgi:hypothetical protein
MKEASMITSRRRSLGIRIGIVTVVVCTATAVHQRDAKADVSPTIIFTAIADTIKAVQTYYSTIDWINCHFGNFCPESDAQQAADRVISSLGALYARYDTSMNLGAFQALLDRVHRDFADPAALTQAEENDLVNQMEYWFEQFSAKLNGFNPTVQAEVDEAYILAPAFNIMASLLDLLARTELVSNHVPMTVDQVNQYRARTLATDEALVGSQATWTTCGGSSTMVSTIDSYDQSFPTRKLWKEFADYTFWTSNCGNSYNCDPFRHVTNTNICYADCSKSNLLHICYACVGPTNESMYRQEYPKILAAMDRDGVVVTVRAAMENLVGAAAANGSGLLWREFGGQLDLLNIHSDNSYKPSVIASADPWAWQPIGTGDFNRDGTGDILWLDSRDGLLSLWEMSGKKVQTMTPATQNVPHVGSGLTPYIGDLDGDGVADIVWTGSITIGTPGGAIPDFMSETWLMNPGSTIPRSVSAASSSTQRVVGLGDFERATSAATAPYRVQKILRDTSGNISLDSGSNTVIGWVPDEWVVKGTGDFNGDRSDDILWYNTSTGEVSIWGIQAYQFVWSANLPTVDPSYGWSIQGIGDVDHDGISDVVWVNTDGSTSIWMMNGDGTLRGGAGTYIGPPVGTPPRTFAGVLALGPQLPMNPQAPLVSVNSCGGTSTQLRNPGFEGWEAWSWSTFDGGYGTLIGDVDGDGKEDLVTLGGSVGLMRSMGTQFEDYETAYNSWFVGNHGTLLGDVTGDGKADLIQLIDGGIWMLSGTNGSPAFSGPTGVWNNTFDGGHGTLIGDVTGDGKADLVTLGDSYVAVLRSHGSSSFTYETGLSTGFWGSIGTYLVDMDGDGRADLVAISPSGITVRRATGASPGNPLFNGYDEIWYQGFWGSHGTFVRDVDGDGRGDVVALDDNQVRVLRANPGGGFRDPEIWYTQGFYGNHASLVGDVDGNGRADVIVTDDGLIAAIRSQ